MFLWETCKKIRTSDSNICDLMICTLPYRSRRLADSQNCSHCSSASSAFWLLPVEEGKGDEHATFSIALGFFLEEHPTAPLSRQIKCIHSSALARQCRSLWC